MRNLTQTALICLHANNGLDEAGQCGRAVDQYPGAEEVDVAVLHPKERRIPPTPTESEVSSRFPNDGHSNAIDTHITLSPELQTQVMSDELGLHALAFEMSAVSIALG